MGRVSVEIGGRALTGWTALTVASTLGAAAGTVAVNGAQLPPQSLNGTEEVEVQHEGRTVFRGFLDEIQAELTEGGVQVNATGRSLTADLVDSQLERALAGGELLGQRVTQIVARYLNASPASIPLVTRRLGAPPLVARHAPNPGETYWSAIERTCRFAGVVATTSRSGGLELISPARFTRANVVLRQGENVLSLRGTTSWTQRARTVVAEGRGDGLGDAWESEIGLRGVAEDAAVRPSRVSVVQVDGAATQADVDGRAQWEVAVRAARGASFTAVVPGWTMPGLDEPWELGTIVGLASPAMRFTGTLVVDAIEHRLSPDGETTQVRLVRRDAYQAAPELSTAGEPTKALTGAGGDW